MINKKCLELVKEYKLDHQDWFNDISVRLNKFLVEKTKVKFDTLEVVAARWIIPINSQMKKLSAINAIQKEIFLEVKEYKKILELINTPLKTSFFESKTKGFEKRDKKIAFHADVLASAYKKIVLKFNQLEKNLIMNNISCTNTNTSNTKVIDLGLQNKVKPTEQKPSTAKKTITKEKIAESKVEKLTKINKDKNIINPLDVNFGEDLLNSLENNRINKPSGTETNFSLEEEIKRIIG